MVQIFYNFHFHLLFGFFFVLQFVCKSPFFNVSRLCLYGAKKKGKMTMKIVKYWHHGDRKIGCNKSHVVGVHWHQIIFLSRGILVLSSENYNILISNSYVLQTTSFCVCIFNSGFDICVML